MTREDKHSPIDKQETTEYYNDPLLELFEKEQKGDELSDSKRNIRRRNKRAHRCPCGAVFSGIGSRWTFRNHQELVHKAGALV